MIKSIIFLNTFSLSIFDSFHSINFSTLFSQVGVATAQTVYMVLFSALFAILLGFPLGVILYSCSSNGIKPLPMLYKVMNKLTNILRSFPFVVLMIILLPLSRLIVGTSIGTTASIVPLAIGATPFMARVAELALAETDAGVVQAARVMGSTNFQIIRKVVIPEALPSLVSGIVITIINLIGYSAMAGVIGGGGLGDLAIRQGYQRYDISYLIASVVVIILMVEIVQFTGDKIINHMRSKR